MPRHRPGTWWLAIGLACTMIGATFFQFSLGSFAPQIAEDIAFSDADRATVVGTLFALSIPVSLIAGRLVDRIGPRRGMAIILVATAAASLLTATASSRSGLLLAVLPASLAMAGCTPVTNRWARDALDPRTRNTLVAFAQTGVQLGAVGTGLLALLGPLLGWRLLVASLLLVVTAAAVATGIGDRARREHGPGRASEGAGPMPATQAEAHDGRPAGMSSPRSRPVVEARTRNGDPRPERDGAPGGAGRFPLMAFTTFAVVMGLPGGVVLAHLATFAVRGPGFSTAAAGATATAYGLVALLVRASLAWLLPPSRRVFGALGLTTVGGAIAMLVIASSATWPSLIWVGAALFGATGLTWPAILMVSVVRRTTAARTASVTGTILAAFYLGLWIGPLLAAVPLGRGSGFGPLWLAAAGLYLIALVPLLWANGIDRRTAPGTAVGA